MANNGKARATYFSGDLLFAQLNWIAGIAKEGIWRSL
jgi:hypothetical protein